MAVDGAFRTRGSRCCQLHQLASLLIQWTKLSDRLAEVLKCIHEFGELLTQIPEVFRCFAHSLCLLTENHAWFHLTIACSGAVYNRGLAWQAGVDSLDADCLSVRGWQSDDLQKDRVDASTGNGCCALVGMTYR